MSVETPPPTIIDPIGRAVWSVLCGSSGPLTKLNDQVEKIKNETKLVSELTSSVDELNSTFKDTNRILQDLLNKL